MKGRKSVGFHVFFIGNNVENNGEISVEKNGKKVYGWTGNSWDMNDWDDVNKKTPRNSDASNPSYFVEEFFHNSSVDQSMKLSVGCQIIFRASNNGMSIWHPQWF